MRQRVRSALGRAAGARATLAAAPWRALLGVALLLLATTLFLGRLPLPLGLDFGYRSCARNVALVVLAGALAGAPGFTLRGSRIGASLVLLAVVASASVVVAGERTSAVALLWSALGVFHATRVLAAGERGRRLVLHGLGVASIAVLARELHHDPSLVLLRESQRLDLVTEHPNTLGFAFALLTPLFLAATASADTRERRAAWLYATCGAATVIATFSRAAWLGLAAATVVLLVGARRTAGSRRALVAGAFATSLIVLGAAGGLSLARADGDAQRIRIAAASLSLFREHWPLGIGFGSAPLERHFPARYLELYGEGLFPFHSHNLYVDVLTGTGVAGAIAGGLLLRALLRVARDGVARARGTAERARAVGHASVLGVFLALGLADTPLYHGRLLLLAMVAWALMENDALHTSGAPAHKSGSDARALGAPAS